MSTISWDTAVLDKAISELKKLSNNDTLRTTTDCFVDSLPTESIGPCAKRLQSYAAPAASICDSLYAMVKVTAAMLNTELKSAIAMDQSHANTFSSGRW